MLFLLPVSQTLIKYLVSILRTIPGKYSLSLPCHPFLSFEQWLSRPSRKSCILYTINLPLFSYSSPNEELDFHMLDPQPSCSSVLPSGQEGKPNRMCINRCADWQWKAMGKSLSHLKKWTKGGELRRLSSQECILLLQRTQVGSHHT